MSKEKLFILIFVSIGAFIGMVLSYGTYFGIHMTSGEKFCVSCHEMDPMVVSYKDDIHGGKGVLGASARCVDCHLPHDNLANYIYTKAKNGIAEVGIHFFGDPDAIDWQEKLKHRQSFVFDTGCLECHGNVMKNDLATTSKQALKMHKHYQELKGTEKEIGCASCHFDAGHKGMRNMLNYYKPEHSMYKEKMEEKKKEVQKKYQKYGIEVHEE
jgi:nitrate/TMAO reductase-like tetraheme cytochrome c subunit